MDVSHLVVGLFALVYAKQQQSAICWYPPASEIPSESIAELPLSPAAVNFIYRNG